MPLRPYCTPINRDDLAEKVLAYINSNEWDDSLKEAVPFIREHVDRVLTVVAPEHMQTKRTLLLRCRDSADFILRRTTEEFPKVSPEHLEAMRREICAQIGLIFYQEYIDRFIKEVAVPYCESHQPPDHWSLGSVQQWSDLEENNQGDIFERFWRWNIEPGGHDEIFKRVVVPHLPKSWQKKCRLVQQQYCPFEWARMSDSQIADTLKMMKFSRHPGAVSWSFYSIESWQGPQGEPWGNSFVGHWVERSLASRKKPDREFERRILPLFPASWQAHYRSVLPRVDVDWKSMEAPAIAKKLSRLQKPADPASNRWTLHTVRHWKNAKGESVGSSFYYYWLRIHSNRCHQAFEEIILPHCPASWRSHYKPYTLKNRDGAQSLTAEQVLP